MKVSVYVHSVDTLYTRRPLWGQPLGDYARKVASEAPETPSRFVAHVTDDMPLVTQSFLERLAEQMQWRGIVTMRLGKGKLFALGHQEDEPRYHCDSEEATVVEDEASFAKCAEALHSRIVHAALQTGAVIPAPATVYADSTVRFAKGVYVSPFVVLEGRTVLGENATLLPFCHLSDVTVGAGATVGGYHRGSTFAQGANAYPYSATAHAGVGTGATLMPFAYATHSLIGDRATQEGASLLDAATIQNRAHLPFGEVCRHKEIEPC